MLRNWCLLLVLIHAFGTQSFTKAAATDPKFAGRVAELVKWLADDDFDRREAAQEELIDLGPAVLPFFERLGPFDNPEVAMRVRKVRRAVGGAAAELREALEADASKVYELDERRDLNPQVRELIAGNQPKTGDFLLSVIGNPKHLLHRLAVNAFVQTWDTMSAEQVHAYLQQSLVLTVKQRPKYPRGVDAMIEMGYSFRNGWAGRPGAEKVKIVTETTHFLDGKTYENPFRYPYDSSGCTTGWVKTKNLAIGRHAVSLMVKYEISHGGKTISGSVRSDEFTFEMVPADAPNELVAPIDAEVEKLVRSGLQVVETEDKFEREDRPVLRFGLQQDTDWWRPQITWKETDGKPNGLHVPLWQLSKPLPVDLCFEVTFRVVETGEEFKGNALIVHRLKGVQQGYFAPKDVHALVKGRTGFVTVQVRLKPSRALALTDPKVTRYFPGEIVTGPLRMKVGPQEELTIPQK